MAWSVPTTWVDGVAVTAADLNLHLRDNLNYLKGAAGPVYIQDAIELAESAAPTTPASGRARLFVGNASPRNGIFACVDDAGVVYQMVRHITGTFTPTYLGSTTPGSTTYASQVGAYTLIGDRVDYEIYLNWTAVTGTGNGVVGALPFTSRNTGNLISIPSLFYNSVTFAAGNGVQARLLPNTTQIDLWTQPLSNVAAAALAIEAAGELIITGTYFI